ncbi:MAG: ABC transporter ATP-binding protein [Lachnospiraceae bacterium]
MIKKFLRVVREYKKDCILAPAFVTLEVILEIFIPMIMALIVDVGMPDKDLPYILKIGGILIIMAFLSLFFGILSGKYAASASAGFSKNLRHDMFHNMQSFSFSNIDKFSTESLVTRLTTDISNVQNAFQMLLRSLFRAPIMLILALIMTLRINFHLSIIFFLAIPILGVGLIFIALRAHPYFKSVFRRYDRLNNIVQENVQGIRVVKAYVREDYEISKFHGISVAVYEKYKAAEKVIIFNSPLMQFVMYTCILLISWFSGQYIAAGTMQTGQFMSVLIYAMLILSSLMMISMIFVMVMIAQASAERIIEVLDEKTEMANPENALTEVADGSIVFENVSFSYRGNPNPSLKNVSFEIGSGEVVGILGGTGSSKSTLVQLIPRLYDVTEGSIKVAGHDVRTYDLETLHTEVAMVLQNNVLFSGTIRENIRWGDQHATDEEVERVCKLAQAHDFIQSFPDGYDTVLEQGGTNVSGGQKQRLCIARALLKKPKILILDDSTSAVDTKTDALIRKAFREEIPDTTKIIIAQRINSVENADKIIVMHAGQIDGIGTSEELLKNNLIYQEVYESQMRGATVNE